MLQEEIKIIKTKHLKFVACEKLNYILVFYKNIIIIEIFLKEMSPTSTTEIDNKFFNSCWNSDLTNAMELMQSGNVSVKQIKKSLLNACSEGNDTIAGWLFDLIPENEIQRELEGLLKTAMTSGKLRIIRLILQNIKPSLVSIITSHVNDNWVHRPFQMACYIGDIDFAKWYLGLVPTLDVSMYDEICFRDACRNGHLDMAKWLLEVKPDINLSSQDCGWTAFVGACENGQLDVVKWLFEINPSIDITKYDFWSACENANNYMDERDQIYYDGKSYKHLDIAKWILEVKPSIKDDMKYSFGDLFLKVCENAQYEYQCYGKKESFDIVTWLIEIRPSLRSLFMENFPSDLYALLKQ